jgi:UDP-N-acetylmuramyl pentapeptide synthase
MVTNGCVDSRLASDGSLFFAMRGENTDGHLYVDHALQSGAV